MRQKDMVRKQTRILWLLAPVVVLTVWCGSVAASEVAESVLYRARVAAEEDRHREAIDLYLRAIDLEPNLRSTVAIELGHQYTWAEMPDSAVAWYGRHLEHHPGDLDARLGIARAMSWADDLDDAEAYYRRLLPQSGDRWNDVLVGLAKTKAWQEDRGAAEEIYRYVLDRDPENTDARLGLAETMNWSGRHREAREMYEGVLEDEPDNTEAKKGLAEALLWMGRADRAKEVIDGAEPDEDIEKTSAAVRSTMNPRGSATYSYRKNTDDGEYQSVYLSGTVPARYLTRVTAAYLRGKLTKKGLSSIDRDQFRVSLEHRFTDTWALTATPGAELNRFDAVVIPPNTGARDDFNLLVWDIYLTVTPRDWVRCDVGSSRETMQIPEPVFRRIHVTTENIGLDWRIAHRAITFWELMYSSYSDGNSRLAASQRGEWRTPIRMPYQRFNELVVLEGVEYFDFKKELDNGYFNPSNYLHLFGGLRFAADIGGRTRLSVEGRFGAERDSGTGWASVGSFSGSLRVRLVGGVALLAGYYESGSRLTSPEGFRAEGFYVTLDLAR
ncbi:MAG: tetratricopeptide repeat protein [Candidatus Latescibacterota bacterium]|nr:MAG: tetratricopeptide repeat protein [Candidatus Latescibacterota bacterium]